MLSWNLFFVVGCFRCWVAWSSPRTSSRTRSHSRLRSVTSTDDHRGHISLAVFHVLGFGGRGVLPGVATGTGLNPKSGKINILPGKYNNIHNK